jgi:hypothetical protein
VGDTDGREAISLYDTATQAAKRISPPGELAFTSAAFSRDNRYFAFDYKKTFAGGDQWQAYVHDRTTGNLSPVAQPPGPGKQSHVKISSDARVVGFQWDTGTPGSSGRRTSAYLFNRKLPPDGPKVLATGPARLIGRSLWLEVKVERRRGWVNGRYLAPVDPPPVTLPTDVGERLVCLFDEAPSRVEVEKDGAAGSPGAAGLRVARRTEVRAGQWRLEIAHPDGSPFLSGALRRSSRCVTQLPDTRGHLPSPPADPRGCRCRAVATGWADRNDAGEIRPEAHSGRWRIADQLVNFRS